MSDGDTSIAAVLLQRRKIQRESGDGNSDWADEEFDNNSLYHDREASKAHTTLFHWDTALGINADRDKWERLTKWNHGKGEDDQSSRKWQAGKVNDAELFCDHLDFSEEQTDRVVQMTKTIDFDQFGSYSTEQVQASLCSLVADEQTTNFEDRIITRTEFKELMDVVQLGSKEHRNVRNAVRERTDYF